MLLVHYIRDLGLSRVILSYYETSWYRLPNEMRVAANLIRWSWIWFMVVYLIILHGDDIRVLNGLQYLLIWLAASLLIKATEFKDGNQVFCLNAIIVTVDIVWLIDTLEITCKLYIAWTCVIYRVKTILSLSLSREKIVCITLSCPKLFEKRRCIIDIPRFRVKLELSNFRILLRPWVQIRSSESCCNYKIIGPSKGVVYPNDLIFFSKFKDGVLGASCERNQLSDEVYWEHDWE